jgi:ABC-2 type transport system ATP-binding protein
MQQLPKGFVIDPSRVALLDNVISMECYERRDGTILRRALDGVSFTVAAGQRFALLGNDAYDLKLLTEILGNIRPYESGRCALVGLGMMREKQRILQHVYYVNDQKLLYLHVQGISWLMHASRHIVKDPIQRQIIWLNRLLEFRLERLCFTYIRNLLPAERVMLLLLLTLDVKVPLILVDLTRIDVPQPLKESFALLFRYLTEKAGKTIIFSTTSGSLADLCATHAALLVNGHVQPAYIGPIVELCDALDNRLYMLRTDDTEAAQIALARTFPGLRLDAEDGMLSLYGARQSAPTPSRVLCALEDAGLRLWDFTTAQPSLDGALKEVSRLAV